MDNPGAIAFRCVDAARAAGTTARYSRWERNVQLRSVHTRVDKSAAVARPGDVNRYRRLLNVFVKSVQMMLTTAHDELCAAFPARLGHQTLANTLEDIEIVEVAVHPRDIVPVPHDSLKIAIR